jgi:multiple sugar transport system substrate-binding protein
LTGTIICLLAVSFSGCAKATPPPEPATIMFAYPDFPGAEVYYQGLIQKFNEQYPYIVVEQSPEITGPTGGFNPDNADVLTAISFNLIRLHEMGDVLSLAPFIDQDESFDLADFYPDAVEMFTSEGETWAIPAGMYVNVMYYNQDVFDANGVSYPETGWTREDFLDAALAVSDPGAYAFGFVPGDEFFDPLLFIYQHGGRIFDDTQDPSRPTFDDPLNIEAMAWYAGLVHDHNVIPTRMQILDQAFGGTIESGVYLSKVGMWTGMLYERGGDQGKWPAEWRFRWGVAPLPRNEQSVTPIFVEGHAISSQAQNPDACWRWVVFLSEQMDQYGATPPRRSFVESEAYEQLVGGEIAAVVRASLEDAELVSFTREDFEDFSLLGSAIQEIVAGRATAYEALTRAQQQAER